MRASITVLICLGVAALSAFVAAGAAAEPKLDVATQDRVWDLAGDYPTGLPVGKTAEHIFTLMNTGTEAVEISSMTSAQPFLVIEAPPATIEPGESAPVKVTVQTESMEPSQFEAYIDVVWNNPAESPKPLVLTVRGRVIPKPEKLFLVRPRETNIGLVRVGQTKQIDYQYENAGTDEFDVRAVVIISPGLEVVKDVITGPCPRAMPGRFTIKYTPSAVDAGKEIDEQFVIPTEPKMEKAVVCHIRGYVAPAEKRPEGVQVIPQFVPAREDADGKMLSPRALLRVVNNTERAIDVVILRGGEEIDRYTLRALGENFLMRDIESEEAFKELSVLVTPYAEEPETLEPATDAGEGEAVEEGTTDGEAGDGAAVEEVTEDSSAPDVGPVDDGETPDSSNEGEASEPVDDGED